MNNWIIILIAVLASAFFSGMEIAFVSSNKLRIELDRKQGVFGSGIIKIFTSNPGQYIVTMLIGNNISLVVYGLIISKILSPVIYPFAGSDLITLVLQTIISSAIIIFVAEFLPKTVFLINPNFFLKALSLPAIFFYLIFYPAGRVTFLAASHLIRLFFGMKKSDSTPEDIVFSKVDLDHFVNLSKQNKEQAEDDHHNIKIFQNALDFSNVKLRECMVPRTEIEALEVNSNIETLREKFIETGHSRILIYEGTIDHITGYFELKDLYKNPSDIKSGIRKLTIVPETMPANKLLKLFAVQKRNVALVVDEFGGTSGMVTIEDVLEEIVGDIEDEHDTNEFTEKIIGDREYIFSGRLETDYLNEKYHLSLPEEDDYETLAGMILFYYGSIPKQNDVVRIANIVIRVLKV
ncbi:MAG: hemolysin, partial [Odoribacter sp.]|nr:hemolysin [Odoribacter sp.]